MGCVCVGCLSGWGGGECECFERVCVGACVYSKSRQRINIKKLKGLSINFMGAKLYKSV